VKVANPKNPVMFSWLLEEGTRLDAPPFLSDAVEARFLLKRLAVRKDRLSSLTSGHDGGIFKGPMFSRTFVEDLEHGVPFLGSSAMLQADLSNLPLLSRKAALSHRLRFLRLEEGTTLVSCSGTIGRTVYVRPDMAGMWSSQHIMKVVPNTDLISPGYLYAFLSSRFGYAQLTAGTYGAIIQHIEARPIAKLQVPRLPDSAEEGIDRLVAEAADARTKASVLLKTAQSLLFQRLGMRRALHDHEYCSPHLGTCNPRDFRSRGEFDTLNWPTSML
jgi:type I restriction enzyme S subunit